MQCRADRAIEKCSGRSVVFGTRDWTGFVRSIQVLSGMLSASKGFRHVGGRQVVTHCKRTCRHVFTVRKVHDEAMMFIVAADAAWVNAKDNEPQTAWMLLVTSSHMRQGGDHEISPLCWKSHRLKRKLGTK